MSRPPLDVVAALSGQRILLTGATGFLGKVLVEKLLFSVPEVGRLLLLVRPADGMSAEERVRREILASPAMARLRARHGTRWEEWAADRLEAVEGEISHPRLDLPPERYADLCRGVDRVVAAAASVRFDERLDHALAVNARGARSALELARGAGEVPLLHVSTCYVSGRRRGRVPERIQAPQPQPGVDGDPDAMLAALSEAARLATDEVAGAEELLVEAGRRMADRYGFADVYTLTKALGERLLERHRGPVPVTIVRPAIVESALAEPIPGWIETVRVADPLLVAYGRGRTRTLPGRADQRLELVPVDLVVNALLAALAEMGEGGSAGVRVYQVGSARHPITLGEAVSHCAAACRRKPFRDAGGRPVRPRAPRFEAPERAARRLARSRRWLARGGALLSRLGAAGGARRMGALGRRLAHFERLTRVYRPYLTHGARYDDRATRTLWERLDPASREAFPFDVSAVDWPSYLRDVHLPGLRRFALRDGEAGPVEAGNGPADGAELQRAAARATGAQTLYDLFAATAEAHADAIAFQTHRDGTWLRYTYRQACHAVAGLARRLSEVHGVRRGDRVALWAGGGPEWVLTAFALHRLGATVVPLDPQWPADEVARAARWVGARLVCAAPRLAPALADAGPRVVELASPFVPEPDAGSPREPVPPAVGERGDVAAVFFTSGTTVAPKAVPLTHGNLLANVGDLVPLMRLERERMLSVLPIHHVFELTVGLLVPLAGGSTVSYVAEVKPAEISWMMQATRPTVLVAVPRLLELLDGGIRASVAAGGAPLRLLFRLLFAASRATGGRLGHRLFGKVHRRFGGSLRRIVSGGAALPASLGRRFRWMGFEVAEGYGMTETAPVLTVNPWDEIHFGSVGRPLPGVELEVRRGEVWVRGANVMSGYLADEQATARVLRDGWLATGDLGELDADGYLHLSGRAKEVIVSAAGKNVHPEEVEARYRGLPGVRELAVVGLPDGGGGERVTAVVALEPEARLEAVRQAIAERSAGIPSYQRVARVESWRGELPKTTTLKVKRRPLREALLAGERGDGERDTGARPAPQPAAAPPAQGREAELLATLARLTRTRPELLSASSRLDELGVDSLARVELVGEIETRFGLSVDDATAGALDRVGDLFELLPASAGR